VRQCTHLTLSRHRHATGSHKTNPGRNTTRTRNANGQKRCAHKRALGSSMGESMAATYGGRFVFAFAWNSLSYQSWPTNGWQHITKIMEKSKNNGIVWKGIATNRIWANLRTNMSRAHKPGHKTFTKLNPWLNVVSVRDSTWSYQVRQTYPGLTVCASVHTSFFHYMPTWFVSWSKKCSRTLFLCDWTAFWRDEKIANAHWRLIRCEQNGWQWRHKITPMVAQPMPIHATTTRFGLNGFVMVHKVNGSQNHIFRKQTNNFSDALRTCSAKMTRPNLKSFLETPVMHVDHHTCENISTRCNKKTEPQPDTH